MKKNVRFHFLSKSVILLILLVGASLSGAQAQVFKWATSFGYSPFMDFGNSMAADGTGNSFYAGAFENSLQLGSTTVNSPGKNLFVARFDPAGGVTWVKHFPNNSFFEGTIYDIVTDAAGNAYVTGAFEDDITIGTTTLSAAILGPDFFLVKLDPAGNVVWLKHGTGSSNDEANSLSLDGMGNIYLAGYSFSFSFTYDGQPVTGSGDGFLLKVNAAGQLVWGKRLEADFMEVATDAAGNGYLTGSFSDTSLGFGNNVTVTHLGGSAFYTGFVAGFNSAGVFSWARVIGGEGAEPNRVRVDPLGNAVVAGTFNNVFTYGTYSLPGAPARPDLFLMKINNSGNLVWAHALENMGINFGQTGFAADPMLELDAAGNPVVANGFLGTVKADARNYLYASSDSSTEIGIVKFTNGGNLLWAEKIGGNGAAIVSGLGVAGNGNVFISGEIIPLNAPTVTTHFGTALALTTTGDKAFVAGMLGTANQIGGKVFVDLNSNGTQDGGEPGAAQIGVSLQGAALPAFSTASGRYTHYAPDGPQQVTLPQAPANFTLTPAAHTLTFAGLGQVDTTRHFALQPIANRPDLEINVAQVTAPRPGFIYRTRLTYRNTGTVTMNGIVKLYSDTLLTFLSALPGTTTVTADTLSWNFTGLQPLESRHILVEWQVPVTAALGTNLNLTAKVTGNATDLTPGNNLLAFTPEVRGSFDPNDKLVSADRISLAQVTAREPLVYTVRFQNTGTDTAFAVMIRDQLSPLLDLQSLEFISASHPVQLKITGPEQLEWRFPNILLPDSNTNERASHGYVQYRIKPLTSAPVGQHIQTSAGIFFDFNAPVNTNLTDTEISNLLATKAPVTRNGSLQVWPNPARNQVQIQFTATGKASLHLINVLGQVVYQESYGQQQGLIRKSLPVQNLPAGIYFIQIDQPGSTSRKQLILQR